jgi:hypothetical protein
MEISAIIEGLLHPPQLLSIIKVHPSRSMIENWERAEVKRFAKQHTRLTMLGAGRLKQAIHGTIKWLVSRYKSEPVQEA